MGKIDDLTWWVRDAANSICGQTGAKSHQDKLHEAADEIDRLRLIEVAARAYIMDSWGTIDVDAINAAREKHDERPMDPEEAALMRALQPLT